MVDATSAAGATRLCCGVPPPEEIVIWEILVRLPPKTLLRCRAVCRAWRRATSTREFLLAHHGRQPSLPLAGSHEYGRRHEYGGSHILAFDHRTAADDTQPHTVARLNGVFDLAASCDGLLVLSKHAMTETTFSICNPATREYAPLGRTHGVKILGLYPHRPTGEYRLLLHSKSSRRWMLAGWLPLGQTGYYVLALGSGKPPRYIGSSKTGPDLRFEAPVLVCDCLHWFTVKRKLVAVFDTIAESFRQIRAPAVPIESNIIEMDGTLGIYTSKIDVTEIEIVDIWVLQNYESEVWNLKYRIKLPVAEIRGRFERHEYYCDVKVVSGHSGLLLLVSFGRCLLYIDINGKLVASFRKDSRRLPVSNFWLKQTLVPHTFFMALEGHDLNASPFN